MLGQGSMGSEQWSFPVWQGGSSRAKESEEAARAAALFEQHISALGSAFWATHSAGRAAAGHGQTSHQARQGTPRSWDKTWARTGNRAGVEEWQQRSSRGQCQLCRGSWGRERPIPSHSFSAGSQSELENGSFVSAPRWVSKPWVSGQMAGAASRNAARGEKQGKLRSWSSHWSLRPRQQSCGERTAPEAAEGPRQLRALPGKEESWGCTFRQMDWSV